jgi:hypothetical protein
VSTNDAAQSGLTLIESLALLGDALPNELPPPPPMPERRGPGSRNGAAATVSTAAAAPATKQ